MILTEKGNLYRLTINNTASSDRGYWDIANLTEEDFKEFIESMEEQRNTYGLNKCFGVPQGDKTLAERLRWNGIGRMRAPKEIERANQIMEQDRKEQDRIDRNRHKAYNYVEQQIKAYTEEKDRLEKSNEIDGQTRHMLPDLFDHLRKAYGMDEIVALSKWITYLFNEEFERLNKKGKKSNKL